MSAPDKETPRKIADYYHGNAVGELEDFEDWAATLESYGSGNEGCFGLCYFAQTELTCHPINFYNEWASLYEADAVPACADFDQGYTKQRAAWAAALAAGLRLYVKECAE